MGNLKKAIEQLVELNKGEDGEIKAWKDKSAKNSKRSQELYDKWDKAGRPTKLTEEHKKAGIIKPAVRGGKGWKEWSDAVTKED